MAFHHLKKNVCAIAWFITALSLPSSVLASSFEKTDGLSLPSQASSMPEALKNIPQAKASCMKDDLVEKTPALSQRTLFKADLNCAITLEQLLNMFSKSSEPVFVDLRSKSDFMRSHIDGSLSMSSSELRTKSFLRNKLVVLLGDGKAEAELYELCSELKNSGFKQTKVLKGGIGTWILDKRPVSGITPDYIDLSSLTAAELFQESKSINSVILTWGNGAKLLNVLPSESIALPDGENAIRDYLQKSKKTKDTRNILLVVDEKFDKNRLAELAKLASPRPVFAYMDTEKNYRAFLQTQKLMWAKQAKGPTKPRCGAL